MPGTKAKKMHNKDACEVDYAHSCEVDYAHSFSCCLILIHLAFSPLQVGRRLTIIF